MRAGLVETVFVVALLGARVGALGVAAFLAGVSALAVAVEEVVVVVFMVMGLKKLTVHTVYTVVSYFASPSTHHAHEAPLHDCSTHLNLKVPICFEPSVFFLTQQVRRLGP